MCFTVYKNLTIVVFLSFKSSIEFEYRSCHLLQKIEKI